MPLVLAMKKGQDFYVGATRIVVTGITKRGFTAKIGETPHKITTYWREVFDGVHLSASIRHSGCGEVVRVMIDAPGLKIVRGALHHTDHGLGPCLVCKGSGQLYTKVTCPGCKGFGCNLCVGGSIKESFGCPECSGKEEL